MWDGLGWLCVIAILFPEGEQDSGNSVKYHPSGRVPDLKVSSDAIYFLSNKPHN